MLVCGAWISLKDRLLITDSTAEIHNKLRLPSLGQSFGNALRVEYVTVVKSNRLTLLIDAFSHDN